MFSIDSLISTSNVLLDMQSRPAHEVGAGTIGDVCRREKMISKYLLLSAAIAFWSSWMMGASLAYEARAYIGRSEHWLLDYQGGPPTHIFNLAGGGQEVIYHKRLVDEYHRVSTCYVDVIVDRRGIIKSARQTNSGPRGIQACGAKGRDY